MNGDFKTDITRDSFQQRKHFSRVIMQQGRVQLDADWNEQTDILLHYMRTFTRDMIGPHAGPKDDTGFAITKYTSSQTATTKTGKASKSKSSKQTDQSDDIYVVVVQKGRYYVDGILCELHEDIRHYTIEDEEVIAATQDTKNEDFNRIFQNAFLFYLDVWEREVTYQEDDSIREVALGGPDTATRAQVICQVRAKAALSIAQLIFGDEVLRGLLNNPGATPEQLTVAWTDFVHDDAHMFPAITSALPDDPRKVGPARLKARTLIPEEDEYTDPCTVPPASHYRGLENQLYRVEVHSSGMAYPDPNKQSSVSARQQSSARQTQAKQGDSEPPTATGTATSYATFKWSRENGSVVFPITSTIAPGTVDTLTVTVSGLGRDDSRFALNVDDWVEIVEYEDTLELEHGNLMRVTAVDDINMQVSLAAPQKQMVGFDTDSNPNKPLLLRRWDYHSMVPGTKGATTLTDDGALEIIENHWLTLEDGVQVLFHRDIDQPSTQRSDNDADDLPPYYHTGDYWLIPARTALGDIEWPHHGNEHEALPVHGIKHHYAPLAYVKFNSDGTQTTELINLRRQIIQGWEAMKP